MLLRTRDHTSSLDTFMVAARVLAAAAAARCCCWCSLLDHRSRSPHTPTPYFELFRVFGVYGIQVLQARHPRPPEKMGGESKRCEAPAIAQRTRGASTTEAKRYACRYLIDNIFGVARLPGCSARHPWNELIPLFRSTHHGF